MSPPLHLNADLVSRFLGWCRSQPDPGCERQLRALDLHLDWWMFALTDRDRAKLQTADLLAQLEGADDREKRVKAIDLLYEFLRAEGLVEATVDPTAGVVVAAAPPV